MSVFHSRYKGSDAGERRYQSSFYQRSRGVVGYQHTQPWHYTTLLDAAKGGGRGGTQQQREETLITSGSDSSDEATRMATIMATQPLASKIGTIAETITTSKKLQGRVILLLVAFLYGTLNVTLRAVYATDGPPAASVLSLVRQCLSIATFLPIFAMTNNDSGEEKRVEDEEISIGRAGMDAQEEGIRPMWMSALELAFWNFGAQGLINAGLLLSPAARASFLTQTSVVLTPLISALAGENINSSVWGGCGLALLGLFLISTSASSGVGEAADAATVSAAASGFNQGDAMILLGALSWSAYIFRTSKLANHYSELNLQFAKTALLAAMYGGWFLSTAASTISAAGASFVSTEGWADALTPLWSGWNSPAVWLLLAYSAVGPGAVADLLQQRGQRETSASESNIILCLESVFAAVCAFALLGEVSSAREIAGGMLIVVAAILASKE
eukprot:CAMPEP_0181079920 /NCGR_PEP_ID=MMETSP1071-20121207/2287_1 /TAXON_ID=35127 /ORGANISM="Thalassiosira sp., Strain NH16" /LENGTH=444 /DNA_ID=CAMNT_0023161355 /DNA_START=335 /DNA_END=1672 /DNA_ORIENTATION=+